MKIAEVLIRAEDTLKRRGEVAEDQAWSHTSAEGHGRGQAVSYTGEMFSDG